MTTFILRSLLIVVWVYVAALLMVRVARVSVREMVRPESLKEEYRHGE